MKELTAAWVKKAEADYLRARSIRRALPRDHDGVCFHCQQAAEKYLKALLVELSISVPRTHNLDDLHHLLYAHHPLVRSVRRGLMFLSNFAVDVRYPGDSASKRQATAALRWVARVRNLVRLELGLPRR
jgi:HEPN domain-containing protein